MSDTQPERTYTLTYPELARLLTYAVHRADCELIAYRRESRTGCTCGLSASMSPIREQESDLESQMRLATNRHVFAGRSTPDWLCKLVPAKYRPLSHRNAYAPSEMSDG